MSVSALAWVPAGLCLFIALILLGHDIHERHIVRLRMTKMRGSLLYADLYGMVRMCRDQCIKTMMVDAAGVVVEFLNEADTKVEYSFRFNGFPLLSDDRAFSLACTLGADIPVLADSHFYRLRKRTRQMPNGRYAVYFEYTATQAYRVQMAHARSLQMAMRKSTIYR